MGEKNSLENFTLNMEGIKWWVKWLGGGGFMQKSIYGEAAALHEVEKFWLVLQIL